MDGDHYANIKSAEVRARIQDAVDAGRLTLDPWIAKRLGMMPDE